MAEPSSSPSPWARFRLPIIVAVGLALLWLIGYWRIHPLDGRLVQISRPSALVLYLTGNYRNAARAYRIAQQGQIELRYADDPSGFWALRAGHQHEAERRAKTTLALVPTAIEPQITLGELALERSQTSEAMRIFTAVLRRQPDHLDALYLGAVAMARAGETESAIQSLNRALRARSVGHRDTALYRILELTGDLRARPAQQQPLCLLAHLHRYLRIFDERQGLLALDYARRAVEAGDRPAEALLTMGAVHDRRGEYAAAHQAMRQAIAVDPRQADALRWLAMEAAAVGDLLTQYQMMTRVFEAAPLDPFYLPDLERVLVKNLGDPLRMATLMERALALDPANTEAQAQLKKALALLAGPDGAPRRSPRVAALSVPRGETK
jgi:tetratricopeptide (TPR) repeat protein